MSLVDSVIKRGICCSAQRFRKTLGAILGAAVLAVPYQSSALEEGNIVYRAGFDELWEVDPETNLNTWIEISSHLPIAVNANGLVSLGVGFFFDTKTQVQTFDPLLSTDNTRLDAQFEDDSNLLVLYETGVAPWPGSKGVLLRFNLLDRTATVLAEESSQEDHWVRFDVSPTGRILVLDVNENENSPPIEILEIDPKTGATTLYYDFGQSHPGVIEDLTMNDVGDLFLTIDYPQDSRSIKFVYRVPSDPQQPPHYVEPFIPQELWSGVSQGVGGEYISSYGNELLVSNWHRDAGNSLDPGIIRLDPYTGTFSLIETTSYPRDLVVVPPPTPVVTVPLWPIEFDIIEQSLYACSTQYSLESSNLCGWVTGGPELSLSFENAGVTSTFGTFSSSNADGKLTLQIDGMVQANVHFFALVKMLVTITPTFSGSVQQATTTVAHILESQPEVSNLPARRTYLHADWRVSNSTPYRWTVADSFFLGPDSEWIDEVNQSSLDPLLQIGSELPARQTKEIRIQSLLGGDVLEVEFPIEISLEGGPGTSISETVTYELKYVPEPGPTMALAAAIACLMILASTRHRCA